MTLDQLKWLRETLLDAKHWCPRFPRLALALAAHESACGQSALARDALNLHGWVVPKNNSAKRSRDGVHYLFERPSETWAKFEWHILNSSLEGYVAARRLLRKGGSGPASIFTERGMVHALVGTYNETDPEWADKVLRWLDAIEKISPDA